MKYFDLYRLLSLVFNRSFKVFILVTFISKFSEFEMIDRNADMLLKLFLEGVLS